MCRGKDVRYNDSYKLPWTAVTVANEILYRSKLGVISLDRGCVCGFCKFMETMAYNNRVAVTGKSRSRRMTGPGLLTRWREVKKIGKPRHPGFPRGPPPWY